jgi:cob(I)alamin adenosyltransferase
LSEGRPLQFDSIVATGKGDDGTTGLLYGGDRVTKDDPRTEAYGTIDEAVAALGMARAELGLKAVLGVLTPGLGTIGDLVLRLQRELFVVAAELATDPGAWDRLEDGRTRVSGAMVDDIGRILADVESRIEMPREFVVPGETRTSAALEMARTILRRAERRAVTLDRADSLPPDSLAVPYLNRVADLLWVLARAAEQAETRQAPPATKRRLPAGADGRAPTSGA